MQDVAKEMNLSETAFLCVQDDGFDLRWFTPAIEVELCGHATLASAHVLWETGRLEPEQTARFYTKSGLLTATRQGEWIELDFPARPAETTTVPVDLAGTLGVRPQYVARNRVHYLVRLDSEQTVRELQPDFDLLKRLPLRGVIVTSAATSPGYDFVSRYFAPQAGVNEDPVTGSAHCCLGPFWASQLGKNELVAYQASSRGGVVRVRVRGERVGLAGQAVTVLRGKFA
jgi:PhzF family phenazine biosynthesis protein